MQLRYKEKAKLNETNSLLSATRPQARLSLKQFNKELQLKTDIRMILKVYVDEENNKKYVDAAAAYALGITNVRAIMTSTRYKEITNDIIDRLRQRNYDIEFIKIPKKEKQKIKVFYEENRYYINSSAAYALGYIDVARFNMDDNLYGPLNESEIKNIRNNYDIEFENIKKQDQGSKVI